jgi:hypothetical protein
VADKRKIHHWLTIVRRIKTGQLFILVIVCGAISIFLLRQNNLQMIVLRQAVTKADADVNGDTKTALTNLQKYVTAHMNTNLENGVYLQETYQRAYTAAVEAAANATNPQAAIYAQVELQCRPIYKSTHSFPAYTQCAHDKLGQLTPGQDTLSSLKAPDVELYHYNFVAPLISFDPAGIFVIITGVILLVIVFRTVTYLVLKLVLKAKPPRI